MDFPTLLQMYTAEIMGAAAVIGVGLVAAFHLRQGKSTDSKTESEKQLEEGASTYETALNKTSSRLGGLWSKLGGQSQVDQDAIDELEETLMMADFGMATTQDLLQELPPQSSPGQLKKILFDRCLDTFPPSPIENGFFDYVKANGPKPYVMMIVGVNGVGKTTTIGKLAMQAKARGLKVLLGAGDTYRAAASEQLKVWAGRAGVDIISRGEGADPASVLFDTLNSAKAKDYDLVICDTAGRLQTKSGLMDELAKCIRVMQKVMPEAPHDTWLVVDATTGQNAIKQATIFSEALSGLSGLVLTKLDGTAKGGVVVAIARELKIPVRFVGIGEKIEDLVPFDALSFTQAILPLDPPGASG